MAAKRKVKLMTVVGARPNFMKAAPIIAAISRHNSESNRGNGTASSNESFCFENVLVHTGQHYDEAMSDRFFADLNIPRPDVHLGAGSASHAVQTADIMKRFETVLLDQQPDVLIVVGDVNSTLACSLVAGKISYNSCGLGPIIAHVESGLRSFDKAMPEEVNRILTDHLADLLFVTEESGVENLRREGISSDKIHFVGNTMIDSLYAFRHKASLSPILDALGLRLSSSTHSPNGAMRYALLTLHRPSNVDRSDGFRTILDGLSELAEQCPVIFPVHPRTKKKIAEFGLEQFFNAPEQNQVGMPLKVADGRISLVDPLGYLDFLCLMDHAALVVTDSGGIQEETTSLGVPCVTVRENTERPITISEGTNVLAGVTKEGIREAARAQLESKRNGRMPQGWDGKSADRILDVISKECSKRSGISLN